MHENNAEVEIKLIEKDNELIITVAKDGGLIMFDKQNTDDIITFPTHTSDLQRIVDMLNYVIKLNQDATIIPG